MVDSAASGLLSPQENSSVWNILRRAHRKNQSLATAVAKLYVTEPDSKHRKWVEQVTGVVCFVKDFLRKSYFIQIIDLDYHQKVWEQELYIEFVYKATQKWFHMFEADHGVAGISFADEREGETFRNVVESKLQSRRKPNRLPSPSSPGTMPRSPSTKRQAQLHNNQVPVPRITTTPTKDKKSIKRGSGKGKKLNKLDISGPDTSSFVHVSGMKMAGGGGMEMIDNSNQLDPRLRKYLVIAGIDPSALDASQLQKATEFAEKEDIYGKIERRKTARRTEKRNTLEKTPKSRMEQISEGPPSVPSRPPPRPDARRPPQPPPAQKPSPNRKPGVPPPPPPSSSSGGGGGTPPPPPPPPPAGGLAPPPLPSFGKPGGGGKPSPAASPGGSKTDLLAAIRNAGGKSGAGLRSVGDRMSSEDRGSVEDGGGDFQSLLAGALDKINTAAGISSSEDESNDSDDWDDED